jgi:pro-apoptotic serine protease NMA111
MSEYVKDPNSPEGWKTICYDKGEERRDLSADSINLNADAMDEDSDGGNSDPEMEE